MFTHVIERTFTEGFQIEIFLDYYVVLNFHLFSYNHNKNVKLTANTLQLTCFIDKYLDEKKTCYSYIKRKLKQTYRSRHQRLAVAEERRSEHPRRDQPHSDGEEAHAGQEGRAREEAHAGQEERAREEANCFTARFVYGRVC